MALDYDRFRFGWTITLPSINLFGSASVKREFGLINYLNNQNDFPSDIILTSSIDSSDYPLLGTQKKTLLLQASSCLGYT